MRITYLMVATYVFDCVLIGTNPYKYFQLNAPTFNAETGIFSKLDIDQLIPEKWRLQQSLLDDSAVPETYPVFVKPEWGQNSSGIFRVDDPQSLDEMRRRVSTSPIKYLVQEASPEQQEYEIFSIQHHQDKQQFAELTVNETKVFFANVVTVPDCPLLFVDLHCPARQPMPVIHHRGDAGVWVIHL